MVKIDSGSSLLAFQHKLQKNDAIKEESAKQTQGPQQEYAIKGEPEQKSLDRAYTQQLKNTNEAIGMLQSADINIKKIQKSLDEINTLAKEYRGAYEDEGRRGELGTSINALKSDADAIIKDAKFLGKEIFGQQLDIKTGSRDIGVEIPGVAISSLNINSQKDIDAAIQRFEQARGDIKTALKDISQAVSEPAKESKHDYSSFDPNVFKNLSGSLF